MLLLYRNPWWNALPGSSRRWCNLLLEYSRKPSPPLLSPHPPPHLGISLRSLSGGLAASGISDVPGAENTRRGTGEGTPWSPGLRSSTSRREESGRGVRLPRAKSQEMKFTKSRVGTS